MTTASISHRKVLAVGPRDAKILIVGEAPGYEEDRTLQPFAGNSGQQLSQMLHEVGIARTDCYITNVCQYRPPENDIDLLIRNKRTASNADFVPCYNKYVHPLLYEGVEELWRDVHTLNPDIIIALGNTALWALTKGEYSGIGNWRGSQLRVDNRYKLVPTYHPAAILRQWAWRAIVITDLRRAILWAAADASDPDYRFIVRPDYSTVISTLDELIAKADKTPFRLANDIETRQNHIACIGLAWSDREAICIPLMCVEKDDGYWSFEEEFEIARRMIRVLTHPNIAHTGQNFIYDTQFFLREYGVAPHTVDDTMVMQHVAFAGMSKGLDFLSSMYCRFHRYWKEEGKLWDPRTTNEDQLWVYNCKDAVVTFEVSETLLKWLESLQLLPQYHERMEFWWSVLRMTVFGVRVDKDARGRLARELIETNLAMEQQLAYVVGHPINVRSPKQLQEFFYGELNLAPIKDRKTGRVSTNFEALGKLAEKEPLVRPIADLLLTQRSIGVFVSTFLEAAVDEDERMRSSFNVAGPETYRLASSQNPFGGGMNLQNIPSGDRKKLLIKMPNIREVFLPDPNCTIFDIDLDRADLQVVVWEANDADLKRQLRLGVDLHIMNGILLAGKEPPPEDELIEGHANYPEHKAKYKNERQLAKNFVHGTNYGGKEKTMAAVCKIPVAHCAKLQARWFDLHPGIKAWHTRVELDLQRHRFVMNAFGFRRYYADRIDGLLPEALAWIPQSTVAIVTGRMQVAVDRNVPDARILIQVHDSIVGQYLTHKEHIVLAQLHQSCLIPIPYPDSLTIPVGIKTSTTSWGACKGTQWPKENLITGLNTTWSTLPH